MTGADQLALNYLGLENAEGLYNILFSHITQINRYTDIFLGLSIIFTQTFLLTTSTHMMTNFKPQKYTTIWNCYILPIVF